MDVLGSQPPPRKGHLRQCGYHALEALTSLFTPKVHICKKYISVHDILDFCPSVIEGKSGAASVSAEMQDHLKVH